jgi:hypothetical protein
VRVGEDADIRYTYQGSDWRAWHMWPVLHTSIEAWKSWETGLPATCIIGGVQWC